jgi:exonuclease SbcC
MVSEEKVDYQVVTEVTEEEAVADSVNAVEGKEEEMEMAVVKKAGEEVAEKEKEVAEKEKEALEKEVAEKEKEALEKEVAEREKVVVKRAVVETEKAVVETEKVETETEEVETEKAVVETEEVQEREEVETEVRKATEDWAMEVAVEVRKVHRHLDKCQRM